MRLLLCLGLMLALIDTSTAAGSKRKPRTHAPIYHQDARQWPPNRGYRSYGDINVYNAQGQVIGRDPDPNVRQQLLDEYYFQRYGR